MKIMHRSQGSGGLTYCCCDCTSLSPCCSTDRSVTCSSNSNCNTRVLICIDDKYCATSTFSAGGESQTFTDTAFESLANPIFINVPGAYSSTFQVSAIVIINKEDMKGKIIINESDIYHSFSYII